MGPDGLVTPMLWSDFSRPTLAAQPVELRVLASSSSANCSALIFGSGSMRRVALIDCGLSPARTRLLLARFGLDFSAIDDALVTHLDGDHFHPGWVAALPRHARLHIHRRHMGRAERAGIATRAVAPFDEPFTLADRARVTSTLLQHDSLGVAVFRFDFEGASLGYATDVGRVTQGLIGALRGVRTLAIESNYCPLMQEASDRPEFLKRRIMDGSGHLSNEQCREVIDAVAPLENVVLLHLSRQCNTPERAAALHADAPYQLVVAGPDRPSRAVVIRAS